MTLPTNYKPSQLVYTNKIFTPKNHSQPPCEKEPEAIYHLPELDQDQIFKPTPIFHILPHDQAYHVLLRGNIINNEGVIRPEHYNKVLPCVDRDDLQGIKHFLELKLEVGSCKLNANLGLLIQDIICNAKDFRLVPEIYIGGDSLVRILGKSYCTKAYSQFDGLNISELLKAIPFEENTSHRLHIIVHLPTNKTSTLWMLKNALCCFLSEHLVEDKSVKDSQITFNVSRSQQYVNLLFKTEDGSVASLTLTLGNASECPLRELKIPIQQLFVNNNDLQSLKMPSVQKWSSSLCGLKDTREFRYGEHIYRWLKLKLSAIHGPLITNPNEEIELLNAFLFPLSLGGHRPLQIATLLEFFLMAKEEYHAVSALFLGIETCLGLKGLMPDREIDTLWKTIGSKLYMDYHNKDIPLFVQHLYHSIRNIFFDQLIDSLGMLALLHLSSQQPIDVSEGLGIFPTSKCGNPAILFKCSFHDHNYSFTIPWDAYRIIKNFSLRIKDTEFNDKLSLLTTLPPLGSCQGPTFLEQLNPYLNVEPDALRDQALALMGNSNTSACHLGLHLLCSAHILKPNSRDLSEILHCMPRALGPEIPFAAKVRLLNLLNQTFESNVIGPLLDSLLEKMKNAANKSVVNHLTGEHPNRQDIAIAVISWLAKSSDKELTSMALDHWNREAFHENSANNKELLDIGFPLILAAANDNLDAAVCSLSKVSRCPGFNPAKLYHALRVVWQKCEKSSGPAKAINTERLTQAICDLTGVQSNDSHEEIWERPELKQFLMKHIEEERSLLDSDLEKCSNASAESSGQAIDTIVLTADMIFSQEKWSADGDIYRKFARSLAAVYERQDPVPAVISQTLKKHGAALFKKLMAHQFFAEASPLLLCMLKSKSTESLAADLLIEQREILLIPNVANQSRECAASAITALMKLPPEKNQKESQRRLQVNLSKILRLLEIYKIPIAKTWTTALIMIFTQGSRDLKAQALQLLVSIADPILKNSSQDRTACWSAAFKSLDLARHEDLMQLLKSPEEIISLFAPPIPKKTHDEALITCVKCLLNAIKQEKPEKRIVLAKKLMLIRRDITPVKGSPAESDLVKLFDIPFIAMFMKTNDGQLVLDCCTLLDPLLAVGPNKEMIAYIIPSITNALSSLARFNEKEHKEVVDRILSLSAKARLCKLPPYNCFECATLLLQKPTPQTLQEASHYFLEIFKGTNPGTQASKLNGNDVTKQMQQLIVLGSQTVHQSITQCLQEKKATRIVSSKNLQELWASLIFYKLSNGVNADTPDLDDLRNSLDLFVAHYQELADYSPELQRDTVEVALTGACILLEEKMAFPLFMQNHEKIFSSLNVKLQSLQRESSSHIMDYLEHYIELVQTLLDSLEACPIQRNKFHLLVKNHILELFKWTKYPIGKEVFELAEKFIFTDIQPEDPLYEQHQTACIELILAGREFGTLENTIDEIIDTPDPSNDDLLNRLLDLKISLTLSNEIVRDLWGKILYHKICKGKTLFAAGNPEPLKSALLTYQSHSSSLYNSSEWEISCMEAALDGALQLLVKADDVMTYSKIHNHIFETIFEYINISASETPHTLDDDLATCSSLLHRVIIEIESNPTHIENLQGLLFGLLKKFMEYKETILQ